MEGRRGQEEEGAEGGGRSKHYVGLQTCLAGTQGKGWAYFSTMFCHMEQTEVGHSPIVPRLTASDVSK